jgi:hypothetical protein
MKKPTRTGGSGGLKIARQVGVDSFLRLVDVEPTSFWLVPKKPDKGVKSHSRRTLAADWFETDVNPSSFRLFRASLGVSSVLFSHSPSNLLQRRIPGSRRLPLVRARQHASVLAT